jgi:hypothetical protein
MLGMDQVHVIRHKVLVEGGSIRGVARQMGVSRNTVRKYLGLSEPVRQECGPHDGPGVSSGETEAGSGGVYSVDPPTWG